MKASDDVTLNRTLHLLDYEKNLRMRELEMRRRQFLHRRLHAKPRATKIDAMLNERREELRRRIQREKVAESQNQATLLERKTELINALKARKSQREPRRSEGNSLEATNKEAQGDEGSPQQVNAAADEPYDYKMNGQNRVANLYQKSFELLKKKKEANRNTFVDSVNSILHKLRDKEDNPKDPFSSLSKNILRKFAGDDFKSSDTRNGKDGEGAATAEKAASENKKDENTFVQPNEGDSGQPGSMIDGKKERNEEQILQKSPSALNLWTTVRKRQMEVRGVVNKQQGIQKMTLKSSSELQDGKEGASREGNKSRKEGLSPDGNKSRRGVSPDCYKSRKEGVSPDCYKSRRGVSPHCNKSRKEGVSPDVKKSGKDGGNPHGNKSRKEGVSPGVEKSGKERVSPDGNRSEKDGGNPDGNKSGKEGGGHGGNISIKDEMSPAAKKSGKKGLTHEGSSKKKETIFQFTVEKPNSSLSPRRSNGNQVNSKNVHQPQESFTPKQEAQREQDPDEIESQTSMVKSVSQNFSRQNSLPGNKKRRKDSQLAGMAIKNRNDNVRTSLTEDCIDECDETSTPNTVVVIHNEHRNIRPSIQWDEGFRYSFSLADDEENSRKLCQTSECSSETVAETAPVPANTDGPGYLDLLDLRQISKDSEPTEIPGTPLSQRSDLPGSPLSMITTSDVRSFERSASRQGEGGKRRLSMQTRGSLRALTEVMRAENRRQLKLQDEDLHPESSAYKTIVEALNGAAADADEHTQRLEKIRQAGLGLQSADRELSLSKSSALFAEKSDKNSRKNLRRNTIDAPGQFSSADVTDSVYKFLQRRSQSKTIRRHKTLSNVELKLLAHAPGEDITGRRHSFPSQQGNRRSSRSVMSGRMSASSGSRRVSADVSALLESEWEQSQKDSARDGSEATRPASVALSELSISDMADFPAKLKDSRSYSWAPDVSETKEWHVLAMELLARKGKGLARFRTVSHMLQWLGEEYRRQTASMMYEELRYCSYLRLPKHQQPVEMVEWDVDTVFGPQSPCPSYSQNS